MIKNDRQLGAPFGLFSDTKANIEAITGLTGGETAYATDSNEFGTFNGATWDWGQGGSFDLADAIHSATPDSTFHDDDEFAKSDSQDSWGLKNFTWANIKSALETFFDTLYQAINTTIPLNGWQEVSDTWTRTGNHTFTVSGDLTATFRKGTKIRYRDGGGDEYGVVASSSHDSGTTTVNLIPNSDYTMAAATITNRFISHIANPEGYPPYFNFTPSFSTSAGMTASLDVNNHSAWWITDASFKFQQDVEVTLGSSASATIASVLPATPALGGTECVVVNCRDGAGGALLVGSGQMNNASLVVRKADGSAWSLGSNRRFISFGEYPL